MPIFDPNTKYRLLNLKTNTYITIGDDKEGHGDVFGKGFSGDDLSQQWHIIEDKKGAGKFFVKSAKSSTLREIYLLVPPGSIAPGGKLKADTPEFIWNISDVDGTEGAILLKTSDAQVLYVEQIKPEPTDKTQLGLKADKGDYSQVWVPVETK